MGTLSKLAAALTAVFVVAVTALVTQLICVKLRQRRFHRRSLGTGDRESITSSANNDALNLYSPSKELLYFFCWRNTQSLVEPDAVRTPEARTGATVPEEIDDILKWHGAMYGPPRFLFTIKEDQERDELFESLPDGINNINNNNNNNCNGATAPPAEEIMKIKRVSLKDCLEVAEPDEADHVDVTVESVEPTPFSTPCASPPYFTPSPSPARDRHVTLDAEETDDLDFISSEREALEFISIEIHGEEIGQE